jgi:hypothetical protein
MSSSRSDMASAVAAKLNAVEGGAKSDREPCWRVTARMSSAGYPEIRLMWRLDRIERARAGVTPQCRDACSAVHNSTPQTYAHCARKSMGLEPSRVVPGPT